MKRIHDHWKQWWKEWSTWLITSGSSIIFFAPELSEGLLHAWSIIPMDLKTSFDPETVRYIGYAVALLAIPAKFVKQKSLDRDASK